MGRGKLTLLDYFTVPECDCVILRSSGDKITTEVFSDPVSLRSLLNKNAEIRITPPEGYYISSLTLGNENEYEISAEDLLSCSYGQKNGTAVSLFLGEISSDNGEAIDADSGSRSHRDHHALQRKCQGHGRQRLLIDLRYKDTVNDVVQCLYQHRHHHWQ